MNLTRILNFALMRAYSFVLLHFMQCWILAGANMEVTSLKELILPKELSCTDLQQKLTLSNRLNCSVEIIEKTRFFELASKKQNMYIKINRLNSEFLAPNFQIEQTVGDFYSKSERFSPERHCFYEGSVLTDETSRVTLNTCDGLEGVIRTSASDYFITPVHKTNSSGTFSEHLLYTPERDISKKAETVSTCGSSELPQHEPKIVHNYDFGYSDDGSLLLRTTRKRRALSVKRYIETMIVADESMFEHYGRKEVELRRYLLSIMAIVTSIMKDSSIGNFIDVSVIKLVILKKNPHSLKISSSASKSLKRFCKWQKRQNKPNDDDPEHYDSAILITRRDICSSADKCDTLGLAELGSVCDPMRSCAIVEDNGLSVAFTIAHELGHLINAPHDGDDNACGGENGKVHIMTPTFSVNLNSWSWSTCSRKFITDFLESADATCLLDKPSPKFEHPLPLKLPGEMFSKDEQCQLIYGKRSVACPFVNRCDRIWCVRYRHGRKSCHTNNMPWTEGTKCGSNSWCIHGSCQLKEKIKPIHGHWGSWGAFGECSKKCGGGIKVAQRECNNPKPRYRGKYCLGHRHKYKSCNIHKCQDKTASFRAEQCSAFDGKELGIPGIPASTKWLPKYSGIKREDSCKLFCEVKGYGLFYELKRKVIDGTKCRKGSNDICVDGQCRPAGCDNVLNSMAKLDHCGVCNGDNSTCRTYTGSKNKTHSGYNFVVHVPRGARQLEVVQLSTKPGKHDTNFLALLDARRQYVFNGEWRISLGQRRYNTYGTVVRYSGPNEIKEKIDVPGILKTALEIRVLSIIGSNSVNIHYSYKFPLHGAQKYKWAIKKQWSECYPVCQGYQVKEYECQRELDSQVVADSKCTGKQPVAKHRMCNLNCELKWQVYKDECIPIDSCGLGAQQQKVVCLKTYKRSLKKESKIMTHKDCHKANVGKMPAREIPCYSPCTRVRWIYTPWSKCNQTCDGGMQSRKASCVDQETNSTQPAAKCDNTPKGPLVRHCNTNPCPKWHTGAWAGVCSVTCGHGFVERIVSCVVAGKTVADDQCSSEAKPDKTRPCIMSACATWKVRAWSKCSEPCGAGHQVREIYCETGAGEKVPETECNTAEKPTDRRKCFEKACQLKAKLISNYPVEKNSLKNVRWLIGGWGECSASCGGGSRERVVACVSNNIIVTENNCDAALKPLEKELCNVFSCPFWRHGAWSKCTKPCGKGSQTRLVLCGYNGTIVSDEWCTGSSKPNERRVCNVHDCRTIGQVPFLDMPQTSSDWKSGPWSECSTSCGAGVKTRSVTCSKADCRNDLKPLDTVSCNIVACPGWNYGQWTPCYTDKNCGKGWQARLVVCQKEDGGILPNNACEKKYKPVTNRTCEEKPCKEDARWAMTPWQPCNVPCGEGTQFRYISCEDHTGEQLPELRCLAIKQRPVQEKRCRRALCPTWYTGPWENCDSSCRHKRIVKCRRGDEVLNDNLCKLENRPVEEKDCPNENCVKQAIFSWHAGRWSPCGASCGYSLRLRAVKCVNEAGLAISDYYCKDVEEKPVKIEQCFEGPCPPKWISEPWSECSTTCGLGIKTRAVYCQSLTNTRLEDSACQTQSKPAETMACSFGSCSDRFRWVTGTWSECSQSCGIGRTTRQVFCYNDQNVTQSRHKCNSENIPANFKVCNVHACPFRSCRDIQNKLRVEFDGEQKLDVGNLTLLVYCEGMHRDNPKEYITLKTDPKENYAEIYGKRLRDVYQCPNNGRRQIPCVGCLDYKASGVTFFKKVRLDVQRMALIPEDKTFADQFGRNPPGFASAGDCYSGSKCPQGRFMVNLLGTGLRVANHVKWTSSGYNASQRIRKLKNNQLIYGKCGGYCGMCSPENSSLNVEIIQSSSR